MCVAQTAKRRRRQARLDKRYRAGKLPKRLQGRTKLLAQQQKSKSAYLNQ